MADGTRLDPYRSYNYRVTAHSKGLTGDLGFAKVSGLEVEVEQTEYREGTDAATARKLPGLAKYSNIVLERGITDNPALVQWLQQVVKLTEESGLPADGDIRAEVTIELLNRNRETVREWVVKQAWPCKLAVGDMDGNSSDVIVETLELCHEGLSLISFA